MRISLIRVCAAVAMSVCAAVCPSVGVAAESGTGVRRLEKAPADTLFPTDWHADILPGYEARYVNQPRAFDGPCRSTIVRRVAPRPSRRAFLYVHGFNDYFFQSEMGERFNDSCINFYAVDLRRYGRSLLPWQYYFDVRDLREYFADIDSALTQMRRDGNTDITLGGHSTGGLTVIYMASERGARVGVRRVVTDSPFLEWNFNALFRHAIIPAASLWGRIAPSTKIRQRHCDGYAYSLLRQYHGEWTYNTDWKLVYSPPVTAGWVHAINNSQGRLRRRGRNIVVPLLVMHSSTRVEGCSWTPAFQHGDCVLDPSMIARRARGLGCGAEVVTIEGGLHDLILSERPARDAAYDSIFLFIRTHP